MSQCCFRWTRGAYSVKKDGEPSSKHDIKFCPTCGVEFEEKIPEIEEDFLPDFEDQSPDQP